MQCLPDEEAESDKGKVGQEQQQEGEGKTVLPHQVKVEGIGSCQDKQRRQ